MWYLNVCVSVCTFLQRKKSNMAPGLKIWKREAEAETDAAKLSEAATTLATKIFGHKHHRTTTESTELETGKFNVGKGPQFWNNSFLYSIFFFTPKPLFPHPFWECDLLSDWKKLSTPAPLEAIVRHTSKDLHIITFEMLIYLRL